MKCAITVRADPPYDGAKKFTLSTIHKYAETVNADLIYLKGRSECSFGDGVWHYKIFRLYDLFDQYDRILNLDSDILINPKCPNLFNITDFNKISTIFEDKGSRLENRRRTIQEIQKTFGDINWKSGYINTGVILFSKHHKNIFTTVGDKFWTGFGYDDVHLGYQIYQNNFYVEEMSFKYNHMSMFSESWNNFADRLQSYIIHYAGNKSKFGQDVFNSNFDLVKHDYKYWYG